MDLAAELDPIMVMRRRALRKARGRRRLMLIVSALALVLAIGGYYALRASAVFNVSSVTVSGGSAKLDASVQKAAEDAAQGRSLLAIDSGAIQSSIEQMPYVRSARIDRAFPNTLSVSVVMYQPQVAVTRGDTTYLVASDSHVIATAKAAPAGVPTVTLPKHATLTAGQTSTNANLAAALMLIDSTPVWFTKRFGDISSVSSASGAITATVGHGMQLRLGAPTQFPLKMQVITRVLGNLAPSRRGILKYVNVSAPGDPALGFRTSG